MVKQLSPHYNNLANLYGNYKQLDFFLNYSVVSFTVKMLDYLPKIPMTNIFLTFLFFFSNDFRIFYATPPFFLKHNITVVIAEYLYCGVTN